MAVPGPAAQHQRGRFKARSQQPDNVPCSNSAALRTLSGVAPVTKRRGKTCIVVLRYAAQVRVRQAVFHWARIAVQHDPRSRSRYEALRSCGHSYGRALRGVADWLLGTACVLLQRQMLFDPITAAQRRRRCPQQPLKTAHPTPARISPPALPIVPSQTRQPVRDRRPGILALPAGPHASSASWQLEPSSRHLRQRNPLLPRLPCKRLHGT